MPYHLQRKRCPKCKKLKRRKQRIQYRLRDINWKERNKPMFSAGNIHYEIADRTRGLAYGGIGGMLVLADKPDW